MPNFMANFYITLFISLIFNLKNIASKYTYTSNFIYDPLKESVLESFKSDLEGYEECKNYLNGTDNSTDNNPWNIMISNSGSELLDFGDETNCIKNDFDYFLFVFNTEQGTYQLKEEKEIINFVGGVDFYIGLCIPKQCKNYIDKLFPPSPRGYYLDNNIISNISFFQDWNNKSLFYIKNEEKYNGVGYTLHWIPFYSLLGITVAYLIIKILSSLFEVLLGEKSKGISQVDKKKSAETEKRKSKNLFSNKDGIESSNQDSDLLFTNNQDLKKSNLDNSVQNKKGFSKVIFYLSIVKDYKFLYQNKSKFYNGTNIEVIYFLKSIMLFLVVYQHTFYSTTKFPMKTYFNEEYYKSFSFGFYKFSIFSSQCFLMLDAVEFGFKLMSYTKKYYYENGYSMSYLLLKFFTLSIPKIIVALANNYFFHYFSPHFIDIFTNGIYKYYYLSTKAHDKYCDQAPWCIFVPFYLAYKDFFDENTALKIDSCYRFIYIYLNQFYLFIIVLLLIGLMFCLKSTIFDIFLLFLWIINIILTFLSFMIVKEEENTTNIYWILGEALTYKETHLYFNYYFAGILVGVTYFYYHDVVSNRPLQSYLNYTPFLYCFKFTQFSFSLNKILKLVLTIIIVCIQILLCLSYNIVRFFEEQSSGETVLTFKPNSFIKFLRMYEVQIFSYLFLILVYLIITVEKESVIQHISGFFIFSFISRVGFSIYASMDYLIYFSFVLFRLQMKLSFFNLCIFSLGFYAVIIFICALMTILFELPFRFIIKNYFSASKEDIGDSSGNSENLNLIVEYANFSE